jgi:hypothetical protein
MRSLDARRKLDAHDDFSLLRDRSCIDCRWATPFDVVYACYALAIIVTLVPGLMSIMVMRVDPRQIEAKGRFDIRRMKMGLRWIFQDRPMREDALAGWLRQLCRWLILLGILDAIAIAALVAMD